MSPSDHHKGAPTPSTHCVPPQENLQRVGGILQLELHQQHELQQLHNEHCQRPREGGGVRGQGLIFASAGQQILACCSPFETDFSSMLPCPSMYGSLRVALEHRLHLLKTHTHTPVNTCTQTHSLSPQSRVATCHPPVESLPASEQEGRRQIE